jgi:transcriptional regulator
LTSIAKTQAKEAGSVYVPKHFQESDWLEIRKVIEDHSFATIVSCDAGVPNATHVPLRLVESSSGEARLQGHVSRANPHWRIFEREPRALVIFAGPHSYVSPRWYDHVNVPTWNYIAVHVYGKARLVTDAEELRLLMKDLVDQYEGGTEGASRYSIETLPPEYLQSQLKGIVGFEISVDEVQASFKLSQNRDAANYDNVIVQLNKSADQGAHGVAEAMGCLRDRKT